MAVSKAEADKLKALIQARKRQHVEESDGSGSDELETSGGDCTVPDKLYNEVVEERNK